MCRGVCTATRQCVQCFTASCACGAPVPIACIAGQQCPLTRFRSQSKHLPCSRGVPLTGCAFNVQEHTEKNKPLLRRASNGVLSSCAFLVVVCVLRSRPAPSLCKKRSAQRKPLAQLRRALLVPVPGALDDRPRPRSHVSKGMF